MCIIEDDTDAEKVNYLVAKRNDFIQKSRFSLTLIEYKILCYCISKIKPGDPHDTEYSISCKDFLSLLGVDSTSYSHVKKTIKSLSDKSWWIKAGDGTLTLMRWFSDINIKPQNGVIDVVFHKKMAEYIFNLQKQRRLDYVSFTSYELKNIIHMKCKYSIRLYELFKSYENRRKWIFEFGTGTDNDICVILSEVDDDGKLVVKKSWNDWKQFKKYVLVPAVSEINGLTDMNISYGVRKESLHGADTRKTSTIVFDIGGNPASSCVGGHETFPADIQDDGLPVNLS